MRKIILGIAVSAVLMGCGQSDAEKDYARCNDEYADDGTYCTEKEFKEFLLLELENDTYLLGGFEDLDAQTQNKLTKEMTYKIDEIFGGED